MSDHDIDQRLREFAVAPEDPADWDDVLRRAGERPSVRHLPRRSLVLALAAVIGVAGALVAAFVTHGTRATSGGHQFGAITVRIPDGSNPWGLYGRQITIDELRAEAPNVPLPNSDLANDDNVGTVWVVDHTSDIDVAAGHVALAVYYPDSGIELLWARGSIEYTGVQPRTIDGVRAVLMPRVVRRLGPTGVTTDRGPLSRLLLPVGADEVLTLEGAVPESDLIAVAHTLSPWPGEASAGEAIGPVGPGGPMTLDHPIPGGVKVSLSDAESALGGPIVLPDTAEVTSSDVGAVWMDRQSALGPTGSASEGGDTGVAVNFPVQGLIVRYERPTLPDPLAYFRKIVSQSPGFKVIWLSNGVPALAIDLLPDGSNWGVIEFVAGGTTVTVTGHRDEAYLRDVAQSILDRTAG
jgi:hypothetical protein